MKYYQAKNEISSYKYILFLFLNAVAIIFGIILQFLIPKDQNWLGKKSLITGIPLLRTWYLSIPFIFSIVIFIYYISFFYLNKDCNDHYNNIFTYLKRLGGFRLFTNLAIFALFYIIYYKLVHPINKAYKFKLSGHVTATLTSGTMLFNIWSVSENMYKFHIGKRSVNLAFYYICGFILIHNTYSIIFTAWIYHHIRESVMAFIITSFYLYIVNFMKVDNIVLLAIYPELPEDNDDNFISKD